MKKDKESLHTCMMKILTLNFGEKEPDHNNNTNYLFAATFPQTSHNLHTLKYIESEWMVVIEHEKTE